MWEAKKDIFPKLKLYRIHNLDTEASYPITYRLEYAGVFAYNLHGRGTK